MSDRVPAHDLRTERALIGSCMLSREIQTSLVDTVEPGNFYRDAHGFVWEALRACERAGELGDTLALSTRLRAAGKLDKVGGDEALLAFTDTIPTLENAESLARRVRELAAVRAVVETCHRIAAEGYEPVDDVPAFLARAERAVALAAEQHVSDAEPVTIGEAAEQSVARLVARQSGKLEDGSPVSTGLGPLDWILAGGFWPGRLYVIAGRPGMGKTSLAQQCATAASKREPALFFSLEMPAEEVGDRAISLDAQIDGERIRASKLSEQEMRGIFAACNRLKGTRVRIDDTPGATLAHVRRVARRQKRRHGLGLVVVDYLQLMRSTGRHDSREQEVSEISRSLKELAKELAVPVVALSQLNRKCDDRGDKRPLLSDLRESGAIEQDADAIVFIYRDDAYNAESKEPGIAELIVAKQRGGRTGTVKVHFRRELTAFYELTGESGGYA